MNTTGPEIAGLGAGAGATTSVVGVAPYLVETEGMLICWANAAPVLDATRAAESTSAEIFINVFSNIETCGIHDAATGLRLARFSYGCKNLS